MPKQAKSKRSGLRDLNAQDNLVHDPAEESTKIEKEIEDTDQVLISSKYPNFYMPSDLKTFYLNANPLEYPTKHLFVQLVRHLLPDHYVWANNDTSSILAKYPILYACIDFMMNFRKNLKMSDYRRCITLTLNNSRSKIKCTDPDFEPEINKLKASQASKKADDNVNCLISANYPNCFMPTKLYKKIEDDAKRNVIPSVNLFTTLVTKLIPDLFEWANRDSESMLKDFESINASFDFLVSKRPSFRLEKIHDLLSNLIDSAQEKILKKQPDYKFGPHNLKRQVDLKEQEEKVKEEENREEQEDEEDNKENQGMPTKRKKINSKTSVAKRQK